jgi:AhpC/TSA family
MSLPTMSLKTELDTFRSEFMATVAPEIRDAIVRADMELAASSIAQRALKAGDQAPDFRLPDARDGYVRLKDLLAPGPVVLSFIGAAGAPIAISNYGRCRKLFRKLPVLARSWSPFRRRLRMRAF